MFPQFSVAASGVFFVAAKVFFVPGNAVKVFFAHVGLINPPLQGQQGQQDLGADHIPLMKMMT